MHEIFVYYLFWHLDIISFESTYLGSGGGTLDVWFTETDFTSPATAFMSSLGGTTSGGSVSCWSYLDTNNASLGTGTALAQLGPYGPPAFSGNSYTSVSSLVAPYSLTMNIAVTHTGSNQNTSFNASLTSIPDATTLVLLGSAMVGAGVFGRKKLFRRG